MPSEPTPTRPLETTSPLPTSLSAVAFLKAEQAATMFAAPPPPSHVPFHQGAVTKGEPHSPQSPLRTAARTSPLRAGSPAVGHPSPPALPAPAAAASPLITHARRGGRAAASVVRRSLTESEWHESMAAVLAPGALGSPFTAMALTPPTPALVPGAAARLAEQAGVAVLATAASPLQLGSRLAALEDRAASEDQVLMGSVAVSGVGLPPFKAAPADDGGSAAGKPTCADGCRSPDENATANA